MVAWECELNGSCPDSTMLVITLARRDGSICTSIDAVESVEYNMTALAAVGLDEPREFILLLVRNGFLGLRIVLLKRTRFVVGKLLQCNRLSDGEVLRKSVPLGLTGRCCLL